MKGKGKAMDVPCASFRSEQDRLEPILELIPELFRDGFTLLRPDPGKLFLQYFPDPSNCLFVGGGKVVKNPADAEHHRSASYAGRRAFPDRSWGSRRNTVTEAHSAEENTWENSSPAYFFMIARRAAAFSPSSSTIVMGPEIMTLL